MHAYEVIVNFFKQGGLFLYPIALIGLIGIAIAIERFVYLTRVAAGNRKCWAELKPAFEAGNFKQAMNLVQASDTTLAQVMRYGLSRIQTARRRDDIEKAMEESLVEVIPRLERRTHYLAALANIGMLMGLFGTVLGLINAFAAVAQVNPAEKASLLSASISVAMNNTALGLLVAITLLLAHVYLETTTTNVIDALEVASVKFLNTLTERPARSAASAALSAGSAPTPMTRPVAGARA